MLVVKTTSVTAGSGAALETAVRPRKRVPSSRRRNPGSVIRVLAANLPLRSGSWRFRRLRSRRSGGRRRWLERNRWSRCRRRRHVLGLGPQALIEDGPRRRRVRRHDLQNKAETEENAAAPPATPSENVTGLIA